MANGVQQVPMGDFTGGITPKLAATDFTERQWAKLEGFVLEGEAELRSQWACQTVGDLTDVVWCVPYQGFSKLFLVAMKFDGSIWWVHAPNVAADAATVNALVWTQLSGMTNGIAPEDRRPAGLIPLKAASSAGFRSGLLLTKGPGPDPDAVPENTAAVALFQQDGTTDLGFVEYQDPYPKLDANGNVGSGKMPRAAFGTMWEDYLVLGNIEWYIDDTQPLSETNVKPFQNGLWFSVGGDPTAFDPINVVFVGDPETNISGMVVIDAGLLVFTSSGPFDTGGAYLLRGNPLSFQIETLSSVGADQGATKWNATGAAAWITETGEVLHTAGDEVLRLDEPLDLDRTTSTSDVLASFGPFLVASRLGRLFAFRVFGQDGAWTELVVPGGATVRRMASIGDHLVFVTGATSGEVYRFVAPEAAARGTIDGAPVTVTVATRTLEGGAGHDGTFWHRFGLRARGPGTLKAITLRPGPALDGDQPTYSYQLDRPLTTRDDLIVPAHGPSVEASAEVTFEGDVRIEQLSWWAHKGKGAR